MGGGDLKSTAALGRGPSTQRSMSHITKKKSSVFEKRLSIKGSETHGLFGKPNIIYINELHNVLYFAVISTGMAACGLAKTVRGAKFS